MNYLWTSICILITTVSTPIVSLIALQWIRTKQVPESLPWIGLEDKRFFPKLRAGFREVTVGRKLMNEGYERYSKQGKAFVLPASLWPDVVLPPSNLTWLAAQPDNVLSGVRVQDDVLALSYLSHGPDLSAIVDFTVVRRDLTRSLSKILPEISEETKLCFAEKLGKDTNEWREVKIFETITETSRRLSNRLFVGLPLCRDERYIKGLQTWEVLFGVSSALIRYLVPSPLKPWLAPIIAIPTQLQAWRLKRFILPIIRRRNASGSFGDKVKTSDERPNDFLQWLMDRTKEKGPSSGMTMSDIAGKAIELNFFSVHTVAINCGSTLTDVLCYESASSLIAELREEAEAILPQLESDPRAIREMVKMDSVIHESLRVNTMGSRGLAREVVAPSGVTTPEGLFLPCGTHVCIVFSSRQRDHDVWDRADEFVPLRFVRSPGDELESAEKPKSAVHVTEDFLSFGYGRHACPGRFFAVQALKLLLGHLLVSYDFEPWKERPKPLEIGEAIVPSDTATIRVRRRHNASI